MMTRDDILTLAKAGFTAAQIAALGSIQPTPAPQPQPEPQPTPAPQPQPTPAPQPDPVQQLLEQMGALTQAVHANALLGAQQPAPQTADDILAEIIAPPGKEIK